MPYLKLNTFFEFNQKCNRVILQLLGRSPHPGSPFSKSGLYAHLDVIVKQNVEFEDYPVYRI